MSAWPHTDLPAPGRVSLGRVVAARMGHARRRASHPMVCPTCNTGTRGECDCPTEGAASSTEIGAEQWRPLSRGESIHFWIVMDVVAFLCYALIVWAFKA